jgi:hypothetical protein
VYAGSDTELSAVVSFHEVTWGELEFVEKTAIAACTRPAADRVAVALVSDPVNTL